VPLQDVSTPVTGTVPLKSFVTLTARVHVEASPFRHLSCVKCPALHPSGESKRCTYLDKLTFQELTVDGGL
jgi:hypothetical protein